MKKKHRYKPTILKLLFELECWYKYFNFIKITLTSSNYMSV